MNDVYQDLQNFSTKDEGISYLNQYKKQELIKFANRLNIRILKSDNKEVIIHKIVSLVIGINIRKRLYDKIKCSDTLTNQE